MHKGLSFSSKINLFNLSFSFCVKKTPVNLQLGLIDFQRGIKLKQKFISTN